MMRWIAVCIAYLAAGIVVLCYRPLIKGVSQELTSWGAEYLRVDRIVNNYSEKSVREGKKKHTQIEIIGVMVIL